MQNIQHAAVGPQTNDAGEWPTLDRMIAARRWLLATSNKVPYYLNGQRRHGSLDAPNDLACLGSYGDALAALAARGTGWTLGFALGPDGTGGSWQGIDFDDVIENGLADLANAVPGYVEVSPSGKGAHAIGYGQPFETLGPNGSGIEAYAAGRYFTVTTHRIRDGGPVCLASFVSVALVPRHGASRRASPANSDEVVMVDPSTISELRSALTFLRADDREQWVAVGHALKELGEVGRGLWLDWSRSSDKFDPAKEPRTWDSFAGKRTGYQAVFKRAQDQGWVNPASNAARGSAANPGPITGGKRQLVGRSLGGVVPRSIDWLWVGWIPKGYITIFAGETGAGKSTVLADVAARVTTGAPWPGDDSAERRSPGRVLWLGSEDSIEEMTVPRLLACGANLENVIEIQGVSESGKRNTFSLQDDLDAITDWLKVAERECLPFAMLVIDPVTSYLPGQKLRRVDLNDAGQLRTVLEPWLVLAQRHNIAIVCVTHFAKDTTRNMLHRVLGSAAFAQTCRSLCAVVEPPQTDDYEPGPYEKALIQVKVNLPEHPGGSWKFSTEKVEVGTDERTGKIIAATRPNWEALDNALTAKTAIGKQRGPKSQLAAPFALWLQFEFGRHQPGTWLPADLLKGTAISDCGVSESWWNKHSPEYLEKANQNGTWMCRLRQTPDPKLQPG
jgi:hypothetical protein